MLLYEYFRSLIFANSDKLRPVAVGLYGMLQSMQYTGNWAGMFAAVIIVFLPTLILFCSCQKKSSAVSPAESKGETGCDAMIALM